MPEAAGQRFIASSGPNGPNDWVIAFEKYFPERTTYPKGDPSIIEKQHANSNNFLGHKAEKVLGIKYHDINTSVKDTVDSLIKRLGI